MSLQYFSASLLSGSILHCSYSKRMVSRGWKMLKLSDFEMYALSLPVDKAVFPRRMHWLGIPFKQGHQLVHPAWGTPAEGIVISFEYYTLRDIPPQYSGVVLDNGMGGSVVIPESSGAGEAAIIIGYYFLVKNLDSDRFDEEEFLLDPNNSGFLGLGVSLLDSHEKVMNYLSLVHLTAGCYEYIAHPADSRQCVNFPVIMPDDITAYFHRQESRLERSNLSSDVSSHKRKKMAAHYYKDFHRRLDQMVSEANMTRAPQGIPSINFNKPGLFFDGPKVRTFADLWEADTTRHQLPVINQELKELLQPVGTADTTLNSYRKIDGATGTDIPQSANIANTALGSVLLLSECTSVFKPSNLQKIATNPVGQGSQTVSTSAKVASTGMVIADYAGAASTALSTATMGVSSVASFFATIKSLYESDQAATKHYKIVRCLQALSNWQGTPAAQGQDQARQAHFQLTYESIRAMAVWLSRKYHHVSEGACASALSNGAQTAVAIGATIALAAASVATAGIVALVGLGIGIFYFLGQQGVAFSHYRNNVQLLWEYAQATYYHFGQLISTAPQQLRPFYQQQYQQELYLFDLARRLHPIRHWFCGATMGDYMRCRIAKFVLEAAIQKRYFSSQHPSDQEQLVNFCSSVFADAIGFDENAALTGLDPSNMAQRSQLILNIADSIPVRGY